MIRVYRVGMWWVEVEDPGVQSGNVGVRQRIRVYRVGMWWGEVDYPGVQSGNVVG